MNINPINSSNWTPQVTASSSVDTGAGGGGGAYAGGGQKEKEHTDEVVFETQGIKDDLEGMDSKSLLTLAKEFLMSLWENMLQLINLKKDK